MEACTAPHNTRAQVPRNRGAKGQAVACGLECAILREVVSFPYGSDAVPLRGQEEAICLVLWHHRKRTTSIADGAHKQSCIALPAHFTPYLYTQARVTATSESYGSVAW